MPRRPSFRRDTNLQDEVRRVNKLVQNKQSRIRVRTGLETEIETAKYKEFQSRKQINEYLKEMEKFLDKKADFKVIGEKGVVYDYQEDVVKVEKAVNKVNKQKKKQWDSFKDMEYKHRGAGTGLTVEQQANPIIGMGDPRFKDWKPVTMPNWNNYESYGDFKRRRDKINERYDDNWLARVNELYRKNYLSALHSQLGWDGRHIYEKLSNLPVEEFIKMYMTENMANIKFLYDRVQAQAKIQELSKIWGVSA